MLLWLIEGDRKLSEAARVALEDSEARLFSAVMAWEFADLQRRGRLPTQAELDAILERLDMTVLPFPESTSTMAGPLPTIHRDPVDRS